MEPSARQRPLEDQKAPLAELIATGDPAGLRLPFPVAVGWLCLVTYLLAIGHYLFVDHGSCAEHGQLVHVDHDHDHSHADAHFAPCDPPEQTGISPSSEDDHEHDHCLVCADRREVTFSFFVLPEVAPAKASEELALLLPPSFVPARRIYEFAPKTSPPSRFD